MIESTISYCIWGKIYTMMHPALLLLLLPASALLLQGAPSEFQTLGTMGVGGIIAGLVLVFYRADRKASEDRYAALAMQYREIVQNQTAISTKILALLEQRAPLLLEEGHRPARKGGHGD